MTRDVGDTKTVKQAEQAEKLELARAEDDIRAVMDLPSGRRFVNGLLGLSGIRGDGYVPGGLEAQRQQDYLAGRRGLGMELLGQIEQHAPAQTELMSAEARKAEVEKKQAAEAAEQQEQHDG